jgi:hypothetical protein
MRKLLTVAAAVAMLSFASGATFAKDVKLTEDQVKTVCGSKLDSHTYKDFKASGCERQCGLKKDKTCSYWCSSKGQKDGKMVCGGFLFD